MSPNIRGAHCEFSGNECDNQFKVCDAYERCFALGPGDNMFESVMIIGTAICEGAMVSTKVAYFWPIINTKRGEK